MLSKDRDDGQRVELTRTSYLFADYLFTFIDQEYSSEFQSDTFQWPLEMNEKTKQKHNILCFL